MAMCEMRVGALFLTFWGTSLSTCTLFVVYPSKLGLFRSCISYTTLRYLAQTCMSSCSRCVYRWEVLELVFVLWFCCCERNSELVLVCALLDGFVIC